MTLFQVGTGSGGMAVLDLVSRDPRVTHVVIVEPDIYKPHNVHRHVFPARDVGKYKADLAAEWVTARRPDIDVRVLKCDLTDPARRHELEAAAAQCDIGICAADNEPAKHHFDRLMRDHGKPWTLGEVLAGGIGGWIHSFEPGGPCYGCVAGHLMRSGPADAPAAPAPDYAHPAGAVPETTVPADAASIHAIAALHAVVTLGLLGGTPPDFTSLLMPLARVPGVFAAAFRPHKVRVAKSLACLVCSAVPVPLAGEDLDVALGLALGKLAHD